MTRAEFLAFLETLISAEALEGALTRTGTEGNDDIFILEV